MWTKEKVHNEIKSIINAIGVMPTVSELRGMGRNDLVCAATKRAGGLMQVAKDIGMSQRLHDSKTGWDGELMFKEIIEGKGFKCCLRNTVKSYYDAIIGDCVRVDVKSARHATYGICQGWFYRMGKQSACDLVAFLQTDTKSIYFVPWHVCPDSNVTITEGGKYAMFKDNYSLLLQYIEMRSIEMDISRRLMAQGAL